MDGATDPCKHGKVPAIGSPAASMGRTESVARPYVQRTNHGGNFCGHQPDAPRLDLIRPTTDKNRPGILRQLQERVRRYYSSPTVIRSLRNANRSRKGRQQRSERREACLLLLSSILEHTDLVSLRCGVPTSSGFLSLTLDYLTRWTGLHPRRAERAMADLKRANLLTVNQPRQLNEDGSWRGLAAVKAVNKHLFTAFGLGRRLSYERDRASKRLARKVAVRGGTLTGWARNVALLVGRLGKKPGRAFRSPAADGPRVSHGMDPATYASARNQLLLDLMTRHPGMPRDDLYAEAERILQERLAKSIRA